jgi:uncharacterized protein
MNPTSPNLPGTASPGLPRHHESRLFSLDVIRGIALLGILLVSISELGGFTANEKSFFVSGTHGGNFKLMTAISMLFEGKMRALLAIVFGAGMLVFLRKKEFPIAISPSDAFIRRQLWLMAFGLVNAFILLWPGDILFQYGVVGILLFAFTRMKAKGFFILAILCTLIYCGKLYWNYADDQSDHKKWLAVTVIEKKFKADSLARAHKDSMSMPADTVMRKEYFAKIKIADSIARKNDTLTKKQVEEKGKWEGMVKDLKYDSSKTVAENKAMRKNWGKVWNHLLQRSKTKESFWLYRIGLWDIASMMFLGMALFSIGFFSGRFSASKHLLIGLLLFAAGFALSWYRIKMGDARIIDYTAYADSHALPYNQFFPFERFFMAAGFVSLVMGLLNSKWLHWLWSGLAKAGQMALSNYILQTLICTFFFYGYGFGYFGRLKQWELYFFVAEVTMVQIVFSVLWLKYYRTGPLEWLLRSLIYRKKLPNKKPVTANPSES